MKRTVEIRSYRLKPGTREAFDRHVREAALPMLRRWGMDVVHAGPSLHDGVSYLLIRAYADVEDRQRQQDAFYGSAEWREGPREAILELIEDYLSVVMDMDAATVAGLRTVEVPHV